MAKQEKKVNVKAYRTKDGKRVKPFSRRQKLLTGAAVGGSVLGLVAAVKNKKAIGNLVKGAKSKSKKVDFSIPENATVPEKYLPDLNDISFGPPNTVAGAGVTKIASSMDNQSRSILQSSRPLELGRQDKPGFFLTYINKKTGNKEHLVSLSFLTGDKDYSGRPIDGVLSIRLPENIDPRFLDSEAIKKAAKSNPNLLSAITRDEAFAQGKADKDEVEKVRKVYENFLKEGFPATNKPNLVDLRERYNKEFG
jgi:hypothetical protein